MIIPLKIKGFAHRFHMQFDTGSPHTYIYENDLNALRKLGLDIIEVEKSESRYVKHLDFQLAGNHIQASMIKIYPNYGHSFNKSDTLSRIGIGTIGSDFMDNRITAIDFKNQNIQFFDKRPAWMATLAKFKSFDFSGRRIMLPVNLDHTAYEFLYDSGCSAFGLITTKNRFDKYANQNLEDIKYDAKSWENQIPIRSKVSDQRISIGHSKLTLKRVSYVDMYTAMQPLLAPFTKIGGWLGNQPFNETTLILDTQTEEFIIIKS